jgi:hypothetical protein
MEAQGSVFKREVYGHAEQKKTARTLNCPCREASDATCGEWSGGGLYRISPYTNYDATKLGELHVNIEKFIEIFLIVNGFP